MREHETDFYKPHAMLAFYKVHRAPKESLKRNQTQEFSTTIDLICTAIDNDEEARKHALKREFMPEDFSDMHSLKLAIAFHKDCSEKVDYYKRKKTMEFIKVFDELRTLTAKSAIEQLKALEIDYKDTRREMKSLREIQSVSVYFKDML